VDVITTRGTLIDLAVGKEGRYDVSSVGGTLNLLRKSFTPKTENTGRSTHPSGYYGDCLEMLCTGNSSEPHSEFFTILSRKIKDLNVVISAEVDCSKGAKARLDCYVEMKTVAEEANLKELPWARRGYMQSYMLGISELQMGYHSERRFRDVVETPIWKLIDDKGYGDRFIPFEDMGRVYTLLGGLRDHFKGSGIAAGERVVLSVDANGMATVPAKVPDTAPATVSSKPTGKHRGCPANQRGPNN